MPTHVLRDTVPDLPEVDPALLREGEGPHPRPHDALAAEVPALRLLEARALPEPPARSEPPDALRLATWNLERCTDVAGAAALLDGFDVALLSEMDLGMARSGNRHTTRDLAGALGAGYLYAVEFVELGLGAGRELVDHAGKRNARAFHGNAIVSRLPLRDPFLVRLDAGGAWFDLDWHHRRLGGRIAVGGVVDLARGPVALASLHLENRSTPEERAAAMRGLLAALDEAAPGLPAVVAGDLNTAALPDPAAEPDLGWFERPDAREPVFAVLREAGFAWTGANRPDQTRRPIPDGRPAPWVQRIDWIFTRGLDASSPRTWPAADEAGRPLSDHELVSVTLR